jgi:hypothetical protein
MDKIKNISCPNCGHRFDVEDVIASQLDQKYKAQLETSRKKLEKQFLEKATLLTLEKEAFEKKKQKENEIFQERLNKALNDKSGEMKKLLRDEYEMQLKRQHEELAEKSKKLQSLKEKEIELARMTRKMGEMEKDLELKFEEKLNLQLRNSESQIQKRIEESMNMRLREKDKQLDDQKKLIEEMKRKSEQGSMQLQGEVMELAIEELLSRSFPHDIVEEVPKGIKGADSILTVRNERMKKCGVIIFESKRTKNFSNEWITKLKQDQRNIGAHLAVLVTEVMPKEMDSFGEFEGVWICSFSELTNVVYVLRQILIRSHAERTAEVNKEEKIEVLYRYLTSMEFKNHITAIVDGFTQMRLDLDKEKRAMASIWKKREKQIELITDNTVNMYGSIRGIAGSAIPTVEQLELPDLDDEEEFLD